MHHEESCSHNPAPAALNRVRDVWTADVRAQGSFGSVSEGTANESTAPRGVEVIGVACCFGSWTRGEGCMPWLYERDESHTHINTNTAFCMRGREGIDVVLEHCIRDEAYNTVNWPLSIWTGALRVAVLIVGSNAVQLSP
jgi:hypothetical protein